MNICKIYVYIHKVNTAECPKKRKLWKSRPKVSVNNVKLFPHIILKKFYQSESSILGNKSIV